MENELKQLIGSGEKVFYEGKPDKKCFILESIFNPMLPIAIIWAIIDFGILGSTLLDNDQISFVIIPFMLFHLMPVWIYLGGVLFMFRKYKNTYYIVTDNAIYISKGIFTKTVVSKPFAELSHINLHRGLFDQMCNVGDVVATTNQLTANNKADVVALNSISDYTEVYNLVKKLQRDIYTDVMYPNDMRPDENHGYNTKYRGL
ncbi:MAG: PH domain-containing protein [Clostridia bacterium]|nr:PH domain-containing protein [Clostridia bacterium]